MPDYSFEQTPGYESGYTSGYNARQTSRHISPTLQPLSVPIKEDRLIVYLNDLKTDADNYWNKTGASSRRGSKGASLKDRRNQNLKYLFGRQLLGRDLKNYESEFLDNVVYEYEKMLKSLAVSKIPDVIIKAGASGDTPQQDLTAELLTKANENRLLSQKFKKALGILFKHLPVYLISVYKYRWDASKNKIGDIVEEVISPDNVTLDHTAKSSDPDEMSFIIHHVSKTGKEWAMLFPKKEEEIKEYIATLHPNVKDPKAKSDWLLAQKIIVDEFWFDWFDKAEDFDVENPRFDFTSGLSWMMGEELLLGQSKNPNWDYEGHDVITLNGENVPPELMQQIMASGQAPQGFEIKKVFNNYFEFPRKPFIFMSFDQFLRSAVDETSRIEQTIPMQKSMDVGERNVDHMVLLNKGKHIWSKDSGMTKKALKKLDMDDPNVDIIIAGDPNSVHSFIQPVMPTPEMLIHLRSRRERMFAKVGVHGATRGEITTSVATTNQIAREADFTQSDDLVDETILHVVTEISRARLHMMKLRYTEEHWKKLVGLEEGKYLELRLDNDSIDDGMEVLVTASTTDKLRAERNAQGMAQLGFTEPLSFYKDMGIPNPEKRAEMLFLKETQPNLYFQKFILKKDIGEMADQVLAASGVLPEGQPIAQPGAVTPAPQVPSPEQAGNVATAVPQSVQGSVRGAIGSVVNGVKSLFNR